MAILGGGRSNDSTLVSQIDNVIQELELDLCQILGIESGQPVNASVFGSGLGAGGDGFAVQADGSIRSIMRFTLGAVASTPNTSCGFEFSDSNESYRIVIVNSELRVYQLQGGTWIQVGNLSVPIVTLVALEDVDMPILDSSVDGFRVVIDTTTVPGEHTFKLVAPPAGEAFNILDAEDIVAPLPTYLNQYLRLLETGPGEYFVGYGAPTGAGGGPYYVGELIDAPSVPVPPIAADAGAVLMQGFGAQATTFIQNLPLVGAASGTIDCPGEETSGTLNWRNIPFLGSSIDTSNGWRSDEFFSDTSQIITIPEPGFYFVKYVMQWPNNPTGNYRAIRLVLNGGVNSQLGNAWRFSPPFRLANGTTHTATSDPLVALDFIRCGSPTTLRLQVAHNAGDQTTELSVTASIGLIKIR